MNYKILVVDDEQNIRQGIKIFLEEEQYDVFDAKNGKEAINILNKHEIDLVLTDIKMAPIDGEGLLQHVISRYPSIPVIILTGHGSVEMAVSFIHKGAYDFLTKPVDLTRMLILFRRALQTRELALQNRRIQEELYKQSRDGVDIISQSRAMQKIMEKIKHVSGASSAVLITGESGVGKEVLCSRLHKLSSRRDNPLINVHCAALTESLLESELFGHEKGSFTGAIAQKKGRFELADGGIIFLDEIGEIDNNLQVKLLRVLQEHEFERVGGEKTLKVDVRVIAATNKDLKEAVERGMFREDLYYRLSVVNIEVPPLRERREDIIRLAQGFLQMFNTENKKKILGFTKKGMNAMLEYKWPGNIRELKNCIESAVVMSTSSYIDLDDMPNLVTSSEMDQKIVLSIDSSLQECERKIIQTVLIKNNWNKSYSAKVLGIGRKTLHNKINEYGIKKT